MATLTADRYRRPLLDPGDALFHRCLTVSATLGALFALAALLAPVRRAVITHVEQLPPRFAKLILEPAAPPRALPERIPVDGPSSAKATPGRAGAIGGGGTGGPGGGGTPVARPSPRTADALPPAAGDGHEGRGPLEPGAGRVGRARAQAEVGAALSGSSRALTSALAGLSSSLGATAPGEPAATGGRAVRTVRAARAAEPLGGGGGGLAVGGEGAELGNSVVVGSLVPIGGDGVGRGGVPGGTGVGAGGSVGGSGGGWGGGNGTGIGSGNGPGGGTGGGYGGGNGTGLGSGNGPGTGGGGSRGPAGPGVYRSNASLLAVIQRYSAGIQYCYGNELKRDPSLRGKLVVAITVAASGEVLEEVLVKDTVGSERLASCALSQIREWRFPPIAEGVTAFQAPFVFTPPE